MRAGAVDRRPPHAVRVEIEMTAHVRNGMTRGEPVGNLPLQVGIAGPLLSGPAPVRGTLARGSRTRMPSVEEGVHLEEHLEEFRGEGDDLEAVLVRGPGIV